MNAWADLDLTAIVEQVARVVWDQQKPPEIAWDRVNDITRHSAREAVLPFVVATRDALAGDVEAMLDRAHADGERAAIAERDRLAAEVETLRRDAEGIRRAWREDKVALDRVRSLLFRRYTGSPGGEDTPEHVREIDALADLYDDRLAADLRAALEVEP